MKFEIKPAQISHLAEVLAILNENSAWMKEAKGIVGQWPEPWPEDYIQGRIEAGEMYLAFVDGQPAGTLALLWSDEETWGDRPGEAGYIYHLAVRRSFAGQGLGRKLLDWAAEQVAAAGKLYLRLDCVAANPVLRKYYPAAGFSLVDVRTVPIDGGRRPVELVLFEKKV